MRRVLVDLNVVLDVLLDRRPYVTTSSAVWAAVEAGRVEGLLAAHAVTTIHYLVRREQSVVKVKETLKALLRVFRVAAVDAGVIEDSLDLPCPDFEDAVTSCAAERAGCDLIITRDRKGFKGGRIRALTPEAALDIFAA
jgi:predicted nucleic acid-binding protein